MSAQKRIGNKDAIVSCSDEERSILDDHFYFAKYSHDASVRQAFCERAVYAHGSDHLYERIAYNPVRDFMANEAIMLCKLSLPDAIRQVCGAKNVRPTLTAYPPLFEDAETLDDVFSCLDHEAKHADDTIARRYEPIWEASTQVMSGFQTVDTIEGRKSMFSTRLAWHIAWGECEAYHEQLRKAETLEISDRIIDIVENGLANNEEVLEHYRAMFDNPVIHGLYPALKEAKLEAERTGACRE